MNNKKIGNLERALIAECVKDVPSFLKINRLFELGADANAVNEYGECVLGIIFEGYCSLYGSNLRSGFFAPYLVRCFLQNGFNTRRHSLKVISELQNGSYDKHIRRAIKILLDERRRAFKQDMHTIGSCIKAISSKIHDKATA